jgi:hypothetical protein
MHSFSISWIFEQCQMVFSVDQCSENISAASFLRIPGRRALPTTRSIVLEMGDRFAFAVYGFGEWPFFNQVIIRAVTNVARCQAEQIFGMDQNVKDCRSNAGFY